MTTEKQALVGTCGFSYPYWREAFYPKELQATKWLSYYSKHFRSVEINMTFYRAPSSTILQRWLHAVPEDFQFSIKASRLITHEKRMHDCLPELTQMWQDLAPLDGRMACVLFQVPPSLYLDLDRLKNFLDLLSQSNPLPVRMAFEFRHHSWYTPAVFESLTSKGHAVVLHDMPNRGGWTPLIREGAPDVLIGSSMQRMKLSDWMQYAQASFLYMRLHGTVQGQAFHEYGERYLRPWARIGREALALDIPLFTYFNNDPDAAATRDARRFGALLGLPVLHADHEPIMAKMF